MDPFTLALATFGVQKLRGKSTGRSFRDALLMGGIGQLGSMTSMGQGMGLQGFGQGAGQLQGATMGAQLRNTGVAKMALGAPQAQGTMIGAGPLHGVSGATQAVGTGGATQAGGGSMFGKARKWWGGLDTGAQLGIGSALAVGGGALLGDDEPEKFDETPYKEAYARQSKLTKGLSKRATYGSRSLFSDQPIYTYHAGGLASLPVQKFAEGGISYMPSKIEHNEKDYNNYLRASGYLEDGSGTGDKNKDTILAQLADGEFVSRSDAILGAGIIEGANPKDDKEMRKKGADFFYKQQAKFKRIFNLLDAGKKTTD